MNSLKMLIKLGNAKEGFILFFSIAIICKAEAR